MRLAYAVFLMFVSGAALAQSTTIITPNDGGGYTVTNPYDINDTRTVTPNPGGGFTSQSPYDPRELEIGTPTGDGGFIVTRPFR